MANRSRFIQKQGGGRDWIVASAIVSEGVTVYLHFSCGHVGFATLDSYMSWEAEEIQISAGGSACPACLKKKGYDYISDMGHRHVIHIWGYQFSSSQQEEPVKEEWEEGYHSTRPGRKNWSAKPKKESD